MPNITTRMPNTTTRMLDPVPDVQPSVSLDAPEKLVARYLELTRTRREIDEQIAYLRSELELVAASALTVDHPRGRFVAPDAGVVAARLLPTCSFDRKTVARELEKGGRLHEVASLPGPALARFLQREPVWAARLGTMVRPRHTIVLMTGG